MNIAPDINAANTEAYPYWPPLGIQTATLIVGRKIAADISDIEVENRIPGNTDYNESDIRMLPIPNAPNNDLTSSLQLEAHSADTGRGASMSLVDLLIMTNKEIGTLDGNV